MHPANGRSARKQGRNTTISDVVYAGADRVAAIDAAGFSLAAWKGVAIILSCA
jgi:hypothetical protein